jgi:hypothetical protein
MPATDNPYDAMERVEIPSDAVPSVELLSSIERDISGVGEFLVGPLFETLEDLSERGYVFTFDEVGRVLISVQTMREYVGQIGAMLDDIAGLDYAIPERYEAEKAVRA